MDAAMMETSLSIPIPPVVASALLKRKVRREVYAKLEMSERNK